MNESGGSVTELEIVRGLERLNVKLDELLRRGEDHETRLRAIEQRPDPAKKHGEQLAKQGEQLADHETRLRTVERWQWKRDAGLALSGGGLGGVVAVVVNALASGGGM